MKPRITKRHITRFFKRLGLAMLGIIVLMEKIARNGATSRRMIAPLRRCAK